MLHENKQTNFFKKKVHDSVFEYSEVVEINESVRKFNRELKKLVEMAGVNFEFVSVEEKFAGHEAYSDDPYLNELVTPLQKEDLDKAQFPPVSAYSFHPNDKGAAVYAECVQEVIDEIGENGLTFTTTEVQGKNPKNYTSASADSAGEETEASIDSAEEESQEETAASADSAGEETAASTDSAEEESQEETAVSSDSSQQETTAPESESAQTDTDTLPSGLYSDEWGLMAQFVLDRNGVSLGGGDYTAQLCFWAQNGSGTIWDTSFNWTDGVWEYDVTDNRSGKSFHLKFTQEIDPNIPEAPYLQLTVTCNEGAYDSLISSEPSETFYDGTLALIDRY